MRRRRARCSQRSAVSAAAASPLRVAFACIVVLCSGFFTSAAAADAFPDKIGYNCVAPHCVYNAGDYAQSKFADGLSCMKSCGQSEIQSIESSLTDIPVMAISSSLNGTCTNCSLVVRTTWNFPAMLDTYDLTPASLASAGCKFTSTMEINLPQLWVLEGSTSNCYINEKLVPCRRDGNRTTVTLSAVTLSALAEPEAEYVFRVDSVSTRRGPGTNTDLTVLNVKFDGTGCRMTTSNSASPRQVFNLELTSNSYKLVGSFTDTKMRATNPQVMATTSVSMSFKSGAVLRAGAFILLRVAKDLEAEFATLIRNVSDAWMLHRGREVALKLLVGKSNISFTIPDSFVGDINNGDTLNITFANFKNPSNDLMTIEKGYLSAYQGLASAVDNSPIQFYHVHKALRERVASRLDIATIVIFGACFLVSLVIIRWHGLPLTMTTLWTDMVAIAALFSFAAGCGGYVVWVAQPSKAFAHWYTAQYFFNTMMILSLCFHWASVLAFKSFKKLSWKSPAVIGYVIANAAVVALIVSLSIAADEELRCVFDEQSLQCSSEKECTGSLAAEGKVVRDAIRDCHIQSFYLAFGAGFVVCTVMLMVLGCMVMSKGRSLMLNEDPSEPRIRNSLTIFYVIIATTCVLYISAQVIYITQYVSGQGSSGELSDLVWYIFIVWLPHGLPPLLLLFLQWNPSTENFHHDEPESIDQGSKEDVFNLTPRSSGSSPHMPYSKLLRDRISMGESMLNNDEPGNKLRLIVRLKLPANFDRACFVSLDFFSSKEPVNGATSLAKICRKAEWKCVGTTEPVGVAGETEAALSNGLSSAIFPFVAVLEVPVVGHASNTLLRFLVHASTIGKRDTGHNFAQNYLDGHTGGGYSSDNRNDAPAAQLSYQMTMFHPLLEFVTSSQAVLDAAASGQPLNVHPTDEHTCTILDDHPSLQREVDVILQGNMNNAELSVQTVMMPGEMPSKDDVSSSHKNIGNIIRFFQYDTEDGGGGLVVEDLQESVYANAIPRQLIELLAVERQEQVEKAREDLHAFLNQKKDKQTRGFYGTLIGQIQDEGDTAIAREWLEQRLKKRKEYVALIRKNIQYLVNRDKHKQYFKASVEKNSSDLRFVPINLHIQDLLIGPTNAFINDEKRRASKEVSVYDFTTVGAPSAHCYKFTKGGILSFQTKLKKLQAKMNGADLDIAKWPEEIREFDDLQWDLQLRMDCSFAQALAALTCSFVRKVEVAIQNPDVVKGEDMLCQLSTMGFLFQVESLLSTHSKEIGMIEDMAGAVAHLSCVAFVLQDVRDKPSNRFSFRMSRRKDVSDEAGIVKVTVSQKHPRGDGKRSSILYVVTVQVATTEVELPDRLASGGEIGVTPLLFTQGINEMQTIANNTERAKTELQDMININNLRPLKAFCEKYSRLAVALPTNSGNYVRGSHRYRNMNQAPMRLTEDQVTQEFRALEAAVLDAAQSLVKTKRPEILKRSSDLCRELGGGRVTVCKSAKDRTAMSVTLEQVRILQRHHDLPDNRIPATVSVMRSHGVRIENALKNTGKRQFAFNKLQRSLLPEEYRCPDQVGGTGNVS